MKACNVVWSTSVEPFDFLIGKWTGVSGKKSWLALEDMLGEKEGPLN
jgi:hypothetical protein